MVAAALSPQLQHFIRFARSVDGDGMQDKKREMPLEAVRKLDLIVEA